MANEESRSGRWIDVAPERLAGWLESFAQRHGTVTAARPWPGPASETVIFRAADGAVAECHVPFPPLAAAGRAAVAPAEASPAAAASAAAPAEAALGQATADTCADYARQIAAHACAERTVGVCLVRLGGYAAGVFTGAGASARGLEGRLAGWCTGAARPGHLAAAVRPAPGEAGQPRRSARRRTPPLRCSARFDGQAGRGGAGRGPAGDRHAARRPAAAAVLRAGRRAVPHGAGSPAHRAAGDAAAVPRRPGPAD